MKLIIEIDENTYRQAKEENDYEVIYNGYEIARAIINGTPVSNEGDLISREALKKVFENLASDDYNEPIWYQKTVFETIDNAPTVAVNCKDCDGYEAGYSAGLKDTERPHGDWIINPDTRTMKCNRCGAVENADRLLVEDMNYCHCCGARMQK